MDAAIAFNQLNLVVHDMVAALAFYRKLGLDITVDDAGQHASARLPNGMLVELDTVEFAKKWNSGYQPSPGGSVVLGFSVASREEVDALYSRLTADGHPGQQPPYDAFWGARYAMVRDPDGNSVGLMSPIDAGRRFWPPSTPPSVG